MSGSQSQAKGTKQMSPNVCDSILCLASTGQYFCFFGWWLVYVIFNQQQRYISAFSMGKAGRTQLFYLIIYYLGFSCVFYQK